jgi:predicted transcriptional regulator
LNFLVIYKFCENKWRYCVFFFFHLQKLDLHQLAELLSRRIRVELLQMQCSLEDEKRAHAKTQALLEATQREQSSLVQQNTSLQQALAQQTELSARLMQINEALQNQNRMLEVRSLGLYLP